MSIYFYVLYNARDMHGSGNGIEVGCVVYMV